MQMQVNNMETVTCAFCEGKGLDPFGILSSRSKCQVCSGKGKAKVKRATIECAFCGGTGVFPGQRITCYICKGLGVVMKPKLGKVCPVCDGNGNSRETPGLPCITCGGKGQI